MKLRNAVNIDDLRRMAKRRLPEMVFDALDGGADDEISLRANRRAYEQILFRPRPLVDVSKRDCSTTVFGERISMPIMLSPTGSARLVSPQAELTLARVAGQTGISYTHSTVASFSPEDVAGAASGPLWFQLYLPPDRDVATRLIERVQDAGYRALVLTIDTPVRGNRERDAHNRFALPYKVTPHLVAEGLSRPVWSTRFLRHNVRLRRSRPTSRKPARLSLRQVESALISARWPATWEDLSFVRGLWRGPLLVKGIMRPDECGELISRGVDGIVVSNHGGRQLDSVPATIEVLHSIVEAVRGQAEVYVDGGVRRGSDVVKALALGARACFIGRPYLYGLAAGGEAGLIRALEILRLEVDRSMALLGCPTIADIGSDLVTSAAAVRNNSGTATTR